MPDFVAGYEAFERLNGALKQLITEWQTIDVRGEGVPNDHSDKDYDDKIIDRLGDLHERAENALDRLAGVLPRFSIYRDKLARRSKRPKTARSSGSATPRSKAITRCGSNCTKICCA